MNLEGMSKKQLLDLTMELAGSLSEEDLHDPETYTMVGQLLDILDDSAHALPQEMIEQLKNITNKQDLFQQAVQMVGLSDPSQLDRLANSLKQAGLLKSEDIDLIKAAPLDLTNSHILMFPVKIKGEHKSEDPEIPDYHVTLKWLGTDKPVEHSKVQDIVKKHKLHPPKITHVEPITWKSPRGDIHVLALHGDHDNLHAAHDELSGENKSIHPYVPHITVSKELHDKVKSGVIKPADLGIECGPLEYKIGPQRIKSFTPAPEAEEHFTKSVNGDFKDDKKYRFKHHEFSGNRGQSIRVYHGSKRIGHLAFSSHSRGDGFHAVFNSEVDREHRGKGIYKEMLRLAGEKAVEKGSKGIKSEGFQRSPDATRVWDKVATHAEPFTNNWKVGNMDGRTRNTSSNDTDYFMEPALKKSYQGSHKAPKNDGYHAPMHDLKGIYPDDIYTDPKAYHYYGSGVREEVKMDKDSLTDIRATKGIPDAKVKIYRAVPKGLATADKINAGDWVTHNKNYAHMHGKRFDEGYNILESEVPAKHLFSEGNSFHEWGYDPSEPDMKKGERGDWKKEGYTIHHSTLKHDDHDAWDSWQKIRDLKFDGPMVPEISDIKGTSWEDETPNSLHEVREKLAAGTHRLTNAEHFAYAKDKHGNPVGGAYIADDGEVMSSGVHPDHQRKGLATAIYSKLKEANNGIIRQGFSSGEAGDLWNSFKKTETVIRKAKETIAKHRK